MKALLLYLGLRHLWRLKLQAALAGGAVALGVALFVSSHVAVRSVAASFEKTLRDLAGEAEWVVTRGGAAGVEERLLLTIRRLPGAVAVPVVQASAVLEEPRGEALLLFGVDLWNDSLLRLYHFAGAAGTTDLSAAALIPDAVFVTRRFARRHGLTVGAEIRIATPAGRRALTVAGILEEEGPARAFGGRMAVVGLSTAQKLFGRRGFVDRIEVAGVEREVLERAVPGYEVSPVVRSDPVVEDALLTLRSLGAVSFAALLLGLFIIYNSVSVAIAERLRETGILRALGATRRQLLGALAVEWGLLGLVSSCLGLALGYALARSLVGLTARTINAVVPIADVRDVVLPPAGAALALALGLAVTLAGALVPAARALRAPATELLRSRSYQARTRYLGAFRSGLLALVLGALLLSLTRWLLPLGLVAWGLLFAGAVLLLPEAMIRVSRHLRPRLGRAWGIEAYLAADNVVKFPHRTALTIIALGGVLGMMVSSAALVSGFRRAADRWIEEAFPFDLSVAASDVSGSMHGSMYGQQTLSDAVAETVGGVAGVAACYRVRQALAAAGDSEVMVIGVETDPFVEMHRRRGLSRWAERFERPQDLRRLRAGAGVYVSENLAHLEDLGPGGTLEIATPSGPASFVVLRAVEDYSWSLGTVWMDLETYRRLWHDETVSYVSLLLAPGAKAREVRRRVLERFGDRPSLFVFARQELADKARDVLDQTMALAYLQVVIAMVLGFLGIANSLLISAVRRQREIGVLRAVGMTRRQVAVTVVCEGALLGLVGGILGVAGGLLGGWYPLRIFTLSFTGFLPPVVFPAAPAALAMAAALGIGIVAGLGPARRTARLDVVEAIGYE